MGRSCIRIHANKYLHRDGRINNTRHFAWCKRLPSDPLQILAVPSPESLPQSGVLFSWRSLRPDIIPPACTQVDDQCWVVAVHRGYWSMMTKCGRSPTLTMDQIFNGVNFRHRNGAGGAIDKVDNAIPFMSNYAEMKVYHRPKLDDISGNEAFESFIEEKLLDCLVAVSLDCLPSYLAWDGEGLYVPTDEDCGTRGFEKFPRHCMVISGHGVEGGFRFWEAEDNFGIKRGDQGFVKFVRDMCLIRAVMVFKVLPED